MRYTCMLLRRCKHITRPSRHRLTYLYMYIYLQHERQVFSVSHLSIVVILYIDYSNTFESFEVEWCSNLTASLVMHVFLCPLFGNLDDLANTVLSTWTTQRWLTTKLCVCVVYDSFIDWSPRPCRTTVASGNLLSLIRKTRVLIPMRDSPPTYLNYNNALQIRIFSSFCRSLLHTPQFLFSSFSN